MCCRTRPTTRRPQSTITRAFKDCLLPKQASWRLRGPIAVLLCGMTCHACLVPLQQSASHHTSQLLAPLGSTYALT